MNYHNFSDSLLYYNGNYYNSLGNKVINLKSGYNGMDFRFGIAPISNEEKCYGLLDKKGKLILEPEFSAIDNYYDSLCAVKIVEHWGFIDLNGKLKIAPIFDSVLRFSEGYAMVRTSNQWVIVSKNFTTISLNHKIEPCNKYPFKSSFVNGLIAVLIDTKVSYLNKNGEIVWMEK